MKLLSSLVTLLAFALAPASGLAADPAPPASLALPDAEAAQKIEIPGVNLTHGPSIVKLGTVAELKLPSGFAFVGPDAIERFYELTQNQRSGQEVGVVLAPDGWLLFFDYDPAGYIKDDEKNELDADKLYSTLEEGTKSGNEYRREKGWDEMKLQGWSTKPFYDPKTNNLTWAFKLSSSSDQHKSISVNESIRLLGRGGVMKVTLVSGVEEFKESETAAQQLLADFSYVSGEKYAEYKKGDKLAKYGLAALVVGGAGAVAVKAGLLGFLGKFWKAIAVGFAAVGTGIVRLWKKISGRDAQ